MIGLLPVTLFTMGKWLISDYIRVTREQREKEIKAIKTDVNNLGQKVRDVKEMVKETNDRFSQVNIEIGKLSVHIENILSRIQN